MMHPIFIVPLDLHNFDFFDRLGAVLEDIFMSEVHTLPAKEMPARGYNHRREQYNSPAVLKAVIQELEKSAGSASPAYRLLVTACDLYTEELNFVFGQAQPGKSTAIISLARLEQERGTDLAFVIGLGVSENAEGTEKISTTFFERTVKEAVHEIGHLKGLSHCPDSGCVMHFSNSLRDTDRKSRYFCSICRSTLGDRGKF